MWRRLFQGSQRDESSELLPRPTAEPHLSGPPGWRLENLDVSLASKSFSSKWESAPEADHLPSSSAHFAEAHRHPATSKGRARATPRSPLTGPLVSSVGPYVFFSLRNCFKMKDSGGIALAGSHSRNSQPNIKIHNRTKGQRVHAEITMSLGSDAMEPGSTTTS